MRQPAHAIDEERIRSKESPYGVFEVKRIKHPSMQLKVVVPEIAMNDAKGFPVEI